MENKFAPWNLTSTTSAPVEIEECEKCKGKKYFGITHICPTNAANPTTIGISVTDGIKIKDKVG